MFDFLLTQLTFEQVAGTALGSITGAVQPCHQTHAANLQRSAVEGFLAFGIGDAGDQRNVKVLVDIAQRGIAKERAKAAAQCQQ